VIWLISVIVTPHVYRTCEGRVRICTFILKSGGKFSLRLKTQSDREPDMSLDELGLSSRHVWFRENLCSYLVEKGKHGKDNI
jgi:hypothetical protein